MATGVMLTDGYSTKRAGRGGQLPRRARDQREVDNATGRLPKAGEGCLVGAGPLAPLSIWRI